MLRDEVPKVADLYNEKLADVRAAERRLEDEERRPSTFNAAAIAETVLLQDIIKNKKKILSRFTEDYNSYSFYRTPLVMYLYLLLPPALGGALAIASFMIAQVAATPDVHDAVDLGLSILPFASIAPHIFCAVWLTDIELQQKGYVQRNRPGFKSPHNNDEEWFRTYVCAECRPSLWGKSNNDRTNIWFDPSKLLTQPVGADRVRVDASLARGSVPNLDAVHVPILTPEVFAQLRQ